MWSLRSSTLASSAAVILSLSSTLLYAQTGPSPEEQALRQRVEELERKLKQLEDRLEQQAQPAQGTVPPRLRGRLNPPKRRNLPSPHLRNRRCRSKSTS